MRIRRIVALLVALMLCVQMMSGNSLASELSTETTETAETIEPTEVMETVEAAESIGEAEPIETEEATEIKEAEVCWYYTDSSDSVFDSFSNESMLDEEQADVVDSGTCGDDLTWALDSEGVLTIRGTGAMTDWDWDWCSAPWFAERSDITKIVIEDGVTSIGNHAFLYCENMTSVTMPESMISIGANAFYGCYALADITIPKNVTSIEEGAFRYCQSMTNVMIPEGVNSLGGGIFYGCRALVSIAVDEFNATYSSENGVLFSKDQSTLVCYPVGRSGSYIIPDSVTNVGDMAFYGCGELTGITISERVISIGDEAFSYCRQLADITIPASVISIGENAFVGCDRLSGIIVDKSNPSYSSEDGVLFDKNMTELIRCPEEKDGSYVIPASVISIGTYAFSTCVNLTDVTIPESVVYIGDYTFSNCDGLTGVVIPASVTSMGKYAFYGCGNLMSITIPGSVNSIGEQSFAWCTSLTSVTILSGVISIGNSAFFNCQSLTEVTIPDSVTTIYSGAFERCDSLTDVYYGGSETDWAKIYIVSGNDCLINACIHYKEVSVVGSGICGDNLFWTLTDDGILTISGTGDMYDWNNDNDRSPWYSDQMISSIVIEDGVTSIGDYAFRGCTKLRNVAIADSVTRIGQRAFAGCYSLSDIEIPDAVTYIGDSAFYDCYGLSDMVTIPGHVTYIGFLAFCFSGIENVIIPACTTNVGYGAFSGCVNLSEIQVENGNEHYTSADGVLICTDSGELVSYPNGKTDTSYAIPSNVTGVGRMAFVFCNDLESIIIPSSVTYLDDLAFYFCSALLSMTIPYSVINIGAQAFYFCNTDLVIYGYEESYAETYANDNNITFAVIDKTNLVREFVARCYSAVLGRDADESELDYWQDELVSGNQTAAQVAAFFVFSDEFKAQNNDDSEFLNRLYITFFGRTADEGGKAYWINYLENGATRNWVTANFVNSAEFEEICANYDMQRGTIKLTDYADQNVNLTMYVYRCYTKILGRAAEEDGLEWWCERIYTGQNQAVDVARGFVLSEEFTAKNLSDEEYVEVLYEAFMGREADDAGMEYWLGLLESGWSREDVLNVFAGCQEFQNILAGFGLN